ncbi:Imm26 family immunity protein [Chitinophaga caseinilytica]|uniref:Imm26 family immunity protein n=1 Tax=Chitinophaga caseinilytica TaxID=2267521 RepID=UPI003C2BF7E8
MARKTSKPGTVFCIPLEENLFAYARQITSALFECFDFFGNQKVDATVVAQQPVLFTLSVHKYVHTDSKWEPIGEVPVPENYPMPLFFHQDIGNEDICHLVDTKGNRTYVPRAACVGYERRAVWDYEHVESRLIDHYHNRENKWEKLLRVKL